MMRKILLGNVRVRQIRRRDICSVVAVCFAIGALGAANAAQPQPTPWPIRHWRNHQPRRNNLTPEESKRIDRLYMQMEKQNPGLIAPAFRRK